MSVPINPNTAVVFPDGQQFFVANISSLQASSANVIVGVGTVVNAYTFAATDAPTAKSIVNQINQAKIGLLSGAVILSNGAGLTWASVTPTTATLAVTNVWDVQGTGFSTAGINNFKADDGSGDALGASGYFFLNSDTDATLGGQDGEFRFFVAGVYTLYYSTDSGTTWISTGLTITAS